MDVNVEKINADAQIPKYQTSGAAGFDFHSTEDVIIDRGGTSLIPTGLKMAVPKGYELQIRPRSGLSGKTKLRIPNSPGTVDSDYRGEINILLYNTGNRAEQISKGDRIAQGVIVPVVQANLEVVDGLEETNRGEGGFGSTGK